MPAKPVVMVGVELHAKRVHSYLTTDGGRTIAAFAVHRRFLEDGVAHEFLGRPLVAFEELNATHPPESHDLCVAVGYRDVNQARARVWQEGLDRGYDHVHYVSRYARCWEPSTIGTRGTLIVEDANVQPYATIGDDCWISGARIGHDALIGDHCWIGAAIISGGATIGDFCFIAPGAAIRDGITVAPRTVVGMGAIIKHDTVEGGVYSAQATPAHSLKSWELRGI